MNEVDPIIPPVWEEFAVHFEEKVFFSLFLRHVRYNHENKAMTRQKAK